MHKISIMLVALCALGAWGFSGDTAFAKNGGNNDKSTEKNNDTNNNNNNNNNDSNNNDRTPTRDDSDSDERRQTIGNNSMMNTGKNRPNMTVSKCYMRKHGKVYLVPCHYKKW